MKAIIAKVLFVAAIILLIFPFTQVYSLIVFENTYPVQVEIFLILVSAVPALFFYSLSKLCSGCTKE